MTVIPSVFKLYYCHVYCDFSIRKYIDFVVTKCIFVTVLSVIIGILPQLIIDDAFIRLLLTVAMTTFAIILVYIATLSSVEKNLLQPIVLNAIRKFRK